MPKSERKTFVGLFTKYTKLLSHHKCEVYSNDAQTLGNVGRAAGPGSWLWAPMDELRSRRTMHVYICYCAVSVFGVCQTNKQTRAQTHTRTQHNNNNRSLTAHNLTEHVIPPPLNTRTRTGAIIPNPMADDGDLVRCYCSSSATPVVVVVVVVVCVRACLFFCLADIKYRHSRVAYVYVRSMPRAQLVHRGP